MKKLFLNSLIALPLFFGIGFISTLVIPKQALADSYGTNFLTGGTCSASSVYTTGFECDKAVDGNTSTAWFSSQNVASDWIYDLGTSTSKTSAKISYYDTASAQSQIVGWYGSNNNSTWTLLTTTTLQTDSAWHDVLFTNTTAYRYYKWDMPSANTWNGVYEIQSFECTSCGSSTSTATSSIMGFMSPQLDFMLQLLVEAIFVVGGLIAGYLVIKRFTGK